MGGVDVSEIIRPRQTTGCSYTGLEGLYGSPYASAKSRTGRGLTFPTSDGFVPELNPFPSFPSLGRSLELINRHRLRLAILHEDFSAFFGDVFLVGENG